MIDRRALLMAGLCVGWQPVVAWAEDAGGGSRADADGDGCYEIKDEIEAEVRNRKFDPSIEALSWAPRLQGN